ncbi:Hypothetical protein MVR_LOCUS123 [uncultured virus]|nr:Hypothetical protein MVR_LOCUS123 [uncultured virus]
MVNSSKDKDLDVVVIAIEMSKVSASRDIQELELVETAVEVIQATALVQVEIGHHRVVTNQAV